MKKTLFIIATPIGNLEDISARALSTLRQSSLVLCEDTRVTKKLLDAYGIEVKTSAVNQHTEDAAIMRLLESAGETLSFVSDAGTPGISDPGGRVSAIARKMEFTVSPIPGPSAVTAMLSICGFPAERYTFLGFPPQKKGRKTFFSDLTNITHTIVIYESKYRIEKTLLELPQDREIALGRELTKKFETTYFGKPAEVLEKLQAASAKGEFVIIISPLNWKTL